MPLPARTYSHKVAIDIPVEDFKLILLQESVDAYREFEFPDLTELLSGMADVGDVEYNGHFGSAIYATFDLDDDGEKPQLDLFIEKIEAFIEDLRRAQRIIPDLFVYPRHTIEKYALEGGPRKLIYSHPDFLLTDSNDDDTVTVFHLKDGEPAMTDVHAPAIRDTLFADVDLRSFDPHKRKVVNISRDIPKVDATILPHIASAAEIRHRQEETRQRPAKAAPDFSGHYLLDDIPAGAIPIHAGTKWIVADSGPEIGASITFRTQGESGSKYFVGPARDQLLGLAEGNPEALDRWIRYTLPEELDGSSVKRRP